MLQRAQILWEYLTVSGTGLYGQVSKRVWWPKAPALSTPWVNGSKAIVFSKAHEDSAFHAEVLEVRFELRCYGGSLFLTDADTVHRALFDRLHGVRHQVMSSGTILSAWLESSVEYEEPVSDWPVVIDLYGMRLKAA